MIYAEGPVIFSLLGRNGSAEFPTVFHPHGLEMFQWRIGAKSNLRSMPMRGITRDHARFATRVLTQGGHLTALLRHRCGADSERIRVLPNALRPGEIGTPRTIEQVPHRFLFVGRSEPVKALPSLLRALRGIDQATLDVVGPHKQTGGTTEATTWHGVIRNRAALHRVMDRCHVFVLPSLAEGMPTVVLEAMARGLPVIATDVGAVSEVVEPGRNGWLVTPGSVPALEGAMKVAMKLSSSEYEAMSQAAIDTIRDRFLSPQLGERLLGILNDAIRSSSQ